MTRTVALIAAVFATGYAIACVLLFFFQRSLIYFPPPPSAPSSGTAMLLAVDGARLRVTVRELPGAKALVYFGGNAPRIRTHTQVIVAERDEVIAGLRTDALLASFNRGIATATVLPAVGHNTISQSPQYLSLLRGGDQSGGQRGY